MRRAAYILKFKAAVHISDFKHEIIQFKVMKGQLTIFAALGFLRDVVLVSVRKN